MKRTEVNCTTGEVTEITLTAAEVAAVLEAEALRVAAQVPASYADLRRAEYPPMEDLIDGLVKDDADQVQAYKDACFAVKKKYPKP